MQISATDKDGTFPANRVTYKIAKTNSKAVQDKFTINPDTGVITTTVELDRVSNFNSGTLHSCSVLQTFFL